MAQGWGLMKEFDSTQQQAALLVCQEKNCTEIKMQKSYRPGLSEHFNLEGVVNLEHAGIYAELGTNHLLPGEYTLRFVILENDVPKGISNAEHVYQVTVSEGGNEKHNVEAFRVYSFKPGSFHSTFGVEWVGQNWNEGAGL